MNVLITEAGGCYTVYMGRGEVLNFEIDTQPSLCRNCIQSFDNMLLQATIIRNYFVKTQTSVASFGPPGLSINGMYLEVSPL